MKYYYVDASNQAAGPLEGPELIKLSEQGTITGETLVVEEGGSDWKPFAEVAPSLTVQAAPVQGTQVIPQAGGAPAAASTGSSDAAPAAGDKSFLVTCLLAIFLGVFGAHRFYAGKILHGVLMLFTCGGLYIWLLIDVIFIALGKFEDSNGNPIRNTGSGGEKSDKDFGVTFLLALFLGPLGVHRFFTGNIVTGIIQLITLGGLFIWSLVDMILLAAGMFKDGQGKPVLH